MLAAWSDIRRGLLSIRTRHIEAFGGCRHESGTPSLQKLLRQPAPLLLVLDLDETLVRVACDNVHRKRKIKIVDFNVAVEIGDPPDTFNCKVRKRPGLDDFFRWIEERRRAGLIEGPWLFTTSSPQYTKALLRHIDPGGRMFGMRVLARQACEPSGMPGFMLKDLSQIPSRGDGAENRKVLVDNNPVSCIVNPDNCVLIRDWLGEDSEDKELARVQATLDLVIQKAGCVRDVESGVSPEELDNYASHLMRLAPERKIFHMRLKALGKRLESGPPENVTSLRKVLQDVSTTCNDIKKELLGAAP
mmetsp:Transcript_6667/g.10695  ORF Transcript_6667/g.10695 Transcript_6667/m.10695 type:complete len:303 (+) Transcript_6667:78-986(+)